MSAAQKTSRKPTGSIRSFTSFMVGIFTRNLMSKTAALALAVLVWITVRQDLTRTEQLQARVVPKLAADLMLLEDPPASVTIDLTGPTSEIDQLRRNPERVEIVLRVTADDLGDDLVDVRNFSVEQGNIEHNFGEHVRITQVVNGTIRMKVAVRGKMRKPVGKPTIIGLPEEWKARFDLVNPEVRLTGPKELLNQIVEVETNPLRAKDVLEETEENEVTTTKELQLTDATLSNRIALLGGEKLLCLITLTRSQAEEPFVVPFSIFIETPDWPVLMKIHETQTVKRTENGSFSINLMLKGSAADLARVKEELTAGRVRAYVRAMDLTSYAGKEKGRGENTAVHLELPLELWGRVTFRSPPREEVDLEVLLRTKESEDGN